MKIHVLNTGFFKLDGGAMFGVVPKSIWQKTNPADSNNMCTWALRSMLIEDGDRLVLIDTGIGDKQRDLIRRGLEDPRVRATHEKVSTRIDEKVSQEIDKFVETKMQQAIKSGKIKKAKRDGFHNMVDAHMKRK